MLLDYMILYLPWKPGETEGYVVLAGHKITHRVQTHMQSTVMVIECV